MTIEPNRSTAPRAKAKRSSAGNVFRWAGLLVLGGFVALLGFGLANTTADDTIDSSLARARPIRPPGFELEVLEPDSTKGLAPNLAAAVADGRLSLAELRGTPVVVNFWASWCPPCRTEAPRLERVWRGARNRGVLVLGLNMQDISDDAREFMDEFGISYPNVRDPEDGVARDWGATGLPETFFIDARGRVVGHVIGAVSIDQLNRGIRAARSGRVLGTQSGGERRATP